MAEEKLVSVTLKSPQYINGDVRQAGEVVLVPEAIAEALSGKHYTPEDLAAIREKEAAKAEKAEEKEAAKVEKAEAKPKDGDK